MSPLIGSPSRPPSAEPLPETSSKTPSKTSGPAEAALVAAARHGDRAAFGELVERFGGQLVFALEGRTSDRDLALDLAQEAWVRVARGLDGFHVGQRFRPWLFAIAFNLARDHRRQSGNRAEFRAEGLLAAEAGGGRPSESLRAVDEQEAIRLALDEVDEPFQTAVRLVDIVGLDHAEAAATLGCAAGTVKSRVSRGRRAFRMSYLRLVGAGGDVETSEQDETPRIKL